VLLKNRRKGNCCGSSGGLAEGVGEGEGTVVGHLNIKVYKGETEGKTLKIPVSYEGTKVRPRNTARLLKSA